MRRPKLFSLCVVALLVGALAVPALTAGAADDKVVTPVHRETTTLNPEPDTGGETARDRFSELFRSVLEWVLRRGPRPPENPSEDPPGRPEVVPTIDPSGYTPGHGD